MNNSPLLKIMEKNAWSRQAVQLLTQCKTLTENKPAAMIIRHSERATIEKPGEIKAMGLTEAGREASIGYGQLLPENRTIRLYHSPVARCRATAECIFEGARSSGIGTEVQGDLGILEGPKADWGKFGEILIRDWPNSFSYWLSGRYPPFIVEPSLDYSKRAALELDSDLGSDTNTLTLHVTHDIAITPLLFHWFGVPPSRDNVGYLNGFMIQKVGGRISLFFKNTRREYELPYWWGAL